MIAGLLFVLLVSLILLVWVTLGKKLVETTEPVKVAKVEEGTLPQDRPFFQNELRLGVWIPETIRVIVGYTPGQGDAQMSSDGTVVYATKPVPVYETQIVYRLNPEWEGKI